MDKEKIETIGLTLEEAAGALRITPKAMSELLRSGKMPAVKLGNRGGWRIHPQAIHEYLLRGDTTGIEDEPE